MPKQTRRNFLKTIGGVTAVGAAAIALAPTGLLKANVPATETPKTGVYSFRAVGGLPQGQFPSYATMVIEGKVDLNTNTGVIMKNVFAGPPSSSSTIALPGLSRVVRVTSVHGSDSSVEVSGVVDDKSQLLRDETDAREFKIDFASKVVQTSFMGSGVHLRLE